MTDTRDAELTRDLEAILAAKTRAQRLSWAWFALALSGMALAIAGRHHLGLILLGLLLAGFSLWRGGRTHLRADALRNDAMQRILAEALRREGGEPGSEPR